MGIVNRDVSPSNIRITYDGIVKILDFGIAKNSKILSSELGILKGKVSHMSPEQIRGIPVDSRSDLFSLGVVLHEMLANKRLFSGKDEFEVMDRVRRAALQRPSIFNPKASRQVDNIVMRLLQKLPEDRYQSASRFYHDAMAILQSYDFSQSELQSYILEIKKAMDDGVTGGTSKSSVVPLLFKTSNVVQIRDTPIGHETQSRKKKAITSTIKTARVLIVCSLIVIVFAIIVAMRKGLIIE